MMLVILNPIARPLRRVYASAYFLRRFITGRRRTRISEDDGERSFHIQGTTAVLFKELNERMQVLLMLTDGRIKLLIICMTVSYIELTTPISICFNVSPHKSAKPSPNVIDFNPHAQSGQGSSEKYSSQA
jgi:hypothetical protein